MSSINEETEAQRTNCAKLLRVPRNDLRYRELSEPWLVYTVRYDPFFGEIVLGTFPTTKLQPSF